MPLSYPAGTLAEHRACRADAAAFDVSHLGTVRVEGDEAAAVLQATLTNDLRKIAPGRAQYTHLLNPDDASVEDDIIIWWVRPGRFDVMPNASNTSGVRAAVGGRDVTAERAVIAVQGPRARARLATFFPDAAAVGHFSVAEMRFEGHPCVVAGTGYTGEDGVECAIALDGATRFFEAAIDAGIMPAGLGARDTVRLEAALPLHSHELGPGITPLQAGLGWVVAWDKGDFRGRAPLDAERRRGVARRLRALVSASRRPPHPHDELAISGASVGSVTSGAFSPHLGRGIALGFLPPEVEIGTGAAIVARDLATPAVVVKPPFHRLDPASL